MPFCPLKRSLSDHSILQVRTLHNQRSRHELTPKRIDARSELNPDDVAKARAMGLKGLVLLSHLRRLVPPLQDGPDAAVLTCLAAFSDESDPWNSSSAQQQASNLIDDYTRSGDLSAMLTSILQERIKPLFSRTGNPAITPQGRKAINPRPSNITMHSDIDAEVKPWKFRDIYIVTVFRWVLQFLDVGVNGIITASHHG